MDSKKYAELQKEYVALINEASAIRVKYPPNRFMKHDRPFRTPRMREILKRLDDIENEIAEDAIMTFVKGIDWDG